MDLFSMNREKKLKKSAPLAEKLRPTDINEFVGQEHIIGKGRLLYRAIKADKISSIIFYGPPGTGKTTLAKIIANTTKKYFKQINAVTSGVKEIRKVIKEAQDSLGMYSKRTILFIDEIHRFNKSQQDALLPYVENGTIILIGATTENPSFEVNKALVSRSMIFRLNPLTDNDIKKILIRAIKDKERGYGRINVSISEEALNHIVATANGDARIALNGLELGILTTKPNEKGRINITLNIAQECVQKRVLSYDKTGDEHYNTISAFIKSMRGSDPDATVYWLAKMIYAGEDPKYIARRIVICASEDVGNADPNALNIAISAFKAVENIGMPEGRIILSQAALYIACAPKSNSCYNAINKALDDIKKNGAGKIPVHIWDSKNKKFEKNICNNNDTTIEDYKYPHSHPNNYVDQQYLPIDRTGTKYYDISNNGYETIIKKRMKKLKNKL